MATEQRSPEILSSGAGLAAAVAVEAGPELGEFEPVRARGYWEQVWLRFRRDKVAIGGGVFILFLFLAAFIGAPIAAHLLGHGPNDQFAGGVSQRTLLAVGATALSMIIGIIMGSIAGYHGGWIDTIVSRVTEIVMAFPLLLFIIALASTVGDRLNNITLGFLGKGVVTLVLVLGFFGWYYPARIVRAQVLSLREKEFIEAARMVGASDARIVRSHLLPHLVAPIIVLSSITVAQFILLEAGLSFLGIGIKQPTPSWGSLLSDGPAYYLSQPWLMVWPGLAILLTTLAFNLLGDGLRDAFDPRSSH